MITREFCEMAFGTSLNGTRVIRVNEPRQGLNAVHVIDAAGDFVDANPFDGTVGTLTGLKRADLVRVVRIVLI